MSDRRRDFAAWADACLETRMKPLFAFTRPAEVPLSEVVRHGRASTLAQDVAEDELDSWARIRHAQPASAKATLDMVEGAAAGQDSYMLRHLEDFDSTAELMEDLRRLPQGAPARAEDCRGPRCRQKVQVAHWPGSRPPGPANNQPALGRHHRGARLHHVARRALGALARAAGGCPHRALGEAEGWLAAHRAPAGGPPRAVAGAQLPAAGPAARARQTSLRTGLGQDHGGRRHQSAGQGGGCVGLRPVGRHRA
eukprot:1611792-Pyramimonas_sp.AAC.1